MNLDLGLEVQKWLFDPAVGKVIALIICGLLILFFKKAAQRLVTKKISDSELRYRSRKIVSFLALILMFFSAGFIFSDKLSSLTVAFGVAGAGIAFALQEVIASIAGWFAINFNNFFKVGDRVQLGGIKGDVIDIGVLRTTLMEVGGWVEGDLYNGRTVRVSNSFVFKDAVFNYSAEYPFLWDEITIPIRHGSSVEYMEKLLHQSAESIVGEFEVSAEREWKNLVTKFMIEDAQVKHIVSLIADENWMSFRLRYVTDFRMRRSTKSKLFKEVLKRVAESDGQVIWATSAMELSTSRPMEIKTLTGISS